MSELNLNDIFVLKKDLEDTSNFISLKSTLDSEAQKYISLNNSRDKMKGEE